MEKAKGSEYRIHCISLKPFMMTDACLPRDRLAPMGDSWQSHSDKEGTWAMEPGEMKEKEREIEGREGRETSRVLQLLSSPPRPPSSSL